jgi:hypothetical protein
MVFIKSALRFARDVVRAYVNHYNDTDYLNWYFKYSKKLKKFKDIHKGEDCFIIGNGPSLNKMDLTPLRNYHTFGLNKIYLLFDKVDLNLSYHVAVNPLVIEQSVNNFKGLNCHSFLSYRPAVKVLPSSEHIHYIMTGGPYSFQADLQKQICEGHTVTYVAMQIAYYMGFKRVFLIGVDHNFFVQGKPNELQTLDGSDPNHFAPNYFGNQQWHLPDLEASELSYHLAKFFYGRDERKIYDATVDGKLEIFPKMSFETALASCSQKK